MAEHYPTVKVCNCAKCNRLLMANTRGRPAGPLKERLFGRVDDRPYCQPCYEVVFYAKHG